jgi:hypothetical protein
MDVWTFEPTSRLTTTQCPLLTYTGVVEINERVRAALARSSGTDFDDHYLQATPRLETADTRYTWVNHTTFVARGRLGRGNIQHEVYRVT